MVVDHEKAWHRLTQFIASKSHHGSTQLLAEMARILSAPDVVVEETRPEQALRLAGVQVQKDRHRTEAAQLEAGGGSSPGGMAGAADHELTLGGHDGHRSNRTEAAGAGRAGDTGSAGPRARAIA